jgi:hypothetical protein
LGISGRVAGFNRSHRARRYLHIEAVFVFDGHLLHLSAALKGTATRSLGAPVSNRENQPTVVASRIDAARRLDIDLERNRIMKTTKTSSIRRVTSFSSRKAKYAAAAAIGMLSVMLSVSGASAFTCVRGVYRTGCVSPYGAVGVSRNGAVAVGRHGSVYAYHRGSGCFWRNGQRICL